MFLVDEKKTKVTEIKEVSFAEIGMKERNHIQKCIINYPKLLGEELLIIQEEFDKFDNTDERFDLLALDKTGNLVIIENKRDDSGTDVYWQAIKYASYVSTMTKSEVINIFGNFLEKNGIAANPEEAINNFLDNDIYYPSDTQRIILVAHNFRPEVLSAVQWLIDQGLDISCIRLRPYKKDNEIILDSDVILPLPEIKDYLIKVGKKNQERKQNQGKSEMNRVFWSEFDSYFENNKDKSVFGNTMFKGLERSYATVTQNHFTYSFVANNSETRFEIISEQDLSPIHTELLNQNANRFNIILMTTKSNAKNKISLSPTEGYSFSDKESWEKIFDFFVKADAFVEQVLLSKMK